jgi:hypothetical protein
MSYRLFNGLPISIISVFWLSCVNLSGFFDNLFLSDYAGKICKTPRTGEG